MIFPITFESWEPFDTYGEAQFYNVTFTEEFGPFNRGDKFQVLYVKGNTLTATDYGDNLEAIREVKATFRLVPSIVPQF